MAKKIGISQSEMLQMREQGLSNKDNRRSAGDQQGNGVPLYRPTGGRMESLAAFNEPKAKEVGTTTEEQKLAPKAVDSLQMVFEVVKSTAGTFRADVDYENGLVALFDHTIEFGEMAELATFIIGLASRVWQKK